MTKIIPSVIITLAVIFIVLTIVRWSRSRGAPPAQGSTGRYRIRIGNIGIHNATISPPMVLASSRYTPRGFRAAEGRVLVN